MTSKVYSKDEAKKIKKRIDNISSVKKNKKAHARRDAEKIKDEMLLLHADKLYYETLLDD